MSRISTWGLFAAGLLVPAAPAVSPAQEPTRHPNVVLTPAGDLGYADLGFQGGADPPTPYLDALTKSGVRCAQGHVPHRCCGPIRTGLLTGRYHQRFGHENNPVYDPGDTQLGLPLDQVT